MDLINSVFDFLYDLGIMLTPILVALLFYFALAKESERRKRHKMVKETLNELPSKVADMLMENASDDNFIVLNVRQDRLIEKTADEIERRKAMRGRKIG